MNLTADISFAKTSGEFNTAADLLRYVASLNPSATREQFVKACSEAGYRENSCANRFRESRAFDVVAFGYVLNKDGSLLIQ